MDARHLNRKSYTYIDSRHLNRKSHHEDTKNTKKHEEGQKAALGPSYLCLRGIVTISVIIAPRTKNYSRFSSCVFVTFSVFVLASGAAAPQATSEIGDCGGGVRRVPIRRGPQPSVAMKRGSDLCDAVSFRVLRGAVKGSVPEHRPARLC